METQTITVATANARRGHMIRNSDGLIPFIKNNVDVLLLSEVVSDRDGLENKLANAGFELVHTDGTDLAIAVRQDRGFSVVSKQTIALTDDGPMKQFFARTRMGRLFGTRNMLLAKLKTESGEEIDVATLHPVPAFKPLARTKQIKAMGDILAKHSIGERLVIGGDFNHYPNPRSVDRNVREQTGLIPVGINGKDTFIYRMRGQLDDMLYRGEGIEATKTKIIDVDSDHRAIITTFSLQKTSSKTLG